MVLRRLKQWEGHIKLTNELRSVSISNKTVKVANTNSITNTNISSNRMPPKLRMLCWFCNTKGDHFATHCPELTDDQKVRLKAERDKEKNRNFNKKGNK